MLAVAYLAGGGGKLIVPKERIAAFGPSALWAGDFSAGASRPSEPWRYWALWA